MFAVCHGSLVRLHVTLRFRSAQSPRFGLCFSDCSSSGMCGRIDLLCLTIVVYSGIFPSVGLFLTLNAL